MSKYFVKRIKTQKRILSFCCFSIVFVFTAGIKGVFADTLDTTRKSVSNIVVEEVDFVGNTVFSDSELEKLLPDLSESISLEQIFSIRKIISNYYLERGYISSGAYIPPQKLIQNKLTVRIIEGNLEKIEIEGLSKLNRKYILSRLPKSGIPLNVKDLARSLSKLERNDLIAKVKGNLTQTSVGKNTLKLDIQEQRALKTEFSIANTYSPSVGTLGGTAKASYHLFGRGDILSFEYGRNEGLDRIGIDYVLPIDRSDGTFTISYANANTEAVDDIVSALDIQADYQAIGFSLLKPIAESDSFQLALGLSFDSIRSETFIGRDFSFAFVEGLEDGRSQINSLRLSQQFISSGESSQFLALSRFNIGLNVFDTTINDLTGVDGLFWSWQGKVQWRQSISPFQVLTSLDLQFSPDTLLPLEQVLIGGYGSVRGYRQNLSLGDNGVAGVIELKYTLLNSLSIGEIELVSFVDSATVWNNQSSINREIQNEFLASLGLGIGYRFDDFVRARLDYGIPLVEVNNGTQAINFVFSITP